MERFSSPVSVDQLDTNLMTGNCFDSLRLGLDEVFVRY